MPGEPLLEVRDLRVDLPGREVLLEISFAVPRAAITGVYGDSGCGKTTLALALMNLLPSPPYRLAGEVRLHGRNLLALSERELESVRGAKIGFVFQDALLALNPVLSIRTQLKEIARAHRIERDPAAALRQAGIAEADRILGSYPHQLSGGERQRVTLAQALLCGPELLIADEPFTALDGPRVVELAALFRKLRDETGMSLVVISHSPGVLAHLADEVLRIDRGSLVDRGNAREVLRGAR